MSKINAYPVDEDLRRTRPMAAMYASIHGMWSLMSEKWSSADYYAKGYKNSEEVYKKCLDEGRTWKELLDFDESSIDNIVL